MIQVHCVSCQAVFDLDERRIPKNGMRVRCPKCATSFHVSPDGQTRAEAPAPAPAPGRAAAPTVPGKPSSAGLPGVGGKLPSVKSTMAYPSLGAMPKVGVPSPPRPALPAPDADFSDLAPDLMDLPPTPSLDELDLPSPVNPSAELPAVAPRVDLPSVATKPLARKPMTPAVRTTGAIPVPASLSSDLDLPSPAVGLPAPKVGGVDLPSLAAPKVDLPVPSKRGTGAFKPLELDDALDLEAVEAPAAPAEFDAPASFGDLDLEMPPPPEEPLRPSVAPALPAPADLPRAAGPRQLGRVALKKQPALPQGVIEENLPNPVTASLPALSGSGLPAVSASGLPAVSGSGLPVPASAGLPNPVGAGLPSVSSNLDFGSPSDLDGFGDLEPPTASPLGMGDSLVSRLSAPAMSAVTSPKPVSLPPAARSSLPGPSELPSDLDDAGFGELDLPMGEEPSSPSTSLPPASSLPPPSSASLPPRSGPAMLTGNLPLPPSLQEKLGAPPSSPSIPPQGAEGKRPAKGGTGFGELDLGDDAPPEEASVPQRASMPGGGSEEFDELPIERTQDRDAGSAGNSLPPTAAPQQKAAPLPERDKGDAAGQKPASRNRGLAVGLGILGLLVVGGGALALTPAGPYGINIIDAQVHGPARAAAARAAIDNAQQALGRDVFGRARAALRRLDETMVQAPGNQELIAFNLFAHYFVLARFGNETALAGRARNLLDRLRTLPTSTPWVPEARAAYALATGGSERVRLRSRDPLSRDLALMIQLEGGDTAQAIDALRTAATQPRATPRTRFQLARALYVGEDLATSARELEGIIREAPEHASARLLLAKILSNRAETRDRAVELGQEVERMTQGPGAASSDERSEAAVLVGTVEMHRDRVTAAREAFDRALAIDPRSSAALVGSATILFRQSNFADARARFQAAQSSDQSDIDARLGIAMCSISLGEPAEARRLLEPMLANHASDARVHYWLAKALNALDDRPAAEREFREALRLDSSNLDAYTTLAALLASMQRADDADRVLQDARSHVADQTAIHRALGESRAARGMFTQAAEELRQAIQGRQDDIRSHFLLANVLRRSREFEGASRELDAVARLDPDYPGLLLERGLLAEGMGRAGDAVSTFRAALQRSPENREIKVRLAAALVANGQAQEAIAELQQFVTANPSYAEGHYVLGRAFLDTGDSANAIRLLERATELDATRADFHAYAAQANLERMQLPRALIHANQSIQLDANYPRGYWVRGEIYVRQGQVRQALEDANRALQLDPTFADAMATLGDADDALDHRREAIELYRRAVSLRPNMGQWHARLGRLLRDEGRGPEAQASLERAVALGDPANPPPQWLAPAHRDLGDMLQSRDRANARRHYERFLELSPQAGPGVAAVRQTLREL